jgi:Rrf2 family transcriptional regulator, repressor of oqxAB
VTAGWPSKDGSYWHFSDIARCPLGVRFQWNIGSPTLGPSGQLLTQAKLLIPLTREGMIVAAIGKGGGLHLGRAAEQITLRDLYLAVMEDKRILVAREDIPTRCRISANINEFFAEVATDAETAMLDALGRRNIADSLAELLRLDAIRMKRLTITANAAE